MSSDNLSPVWAGIKDHMEQKLKESKWLCQEIEASRDDEKKGIKPSQKPKPLNDIGKLITGKYNQDGTDISMSAQYYQASGGYLILEHLVERFDDYLGYPLGYLNYALTELIRMEQRTLDKSKAKISKLTVKDATGLADLFQSTQISCGVIDAITELHQHITQVIDKMQDDDEEVNDG